VAEDFGLLEEDTMSLGNHIPKFQRNILP